MTGRQSLALMLAGLGLPREALCAGTAAMESAASIIQRQVDAGILDSAVLHVRRSNETFQRAFGKAADADAVFLLASITKPMVAAAVMVLADRGELHLVTKMPGIFLHGIF